jgi:sphinganine-1-phosphate aldolase
MKERGWGIDAQHLPPALHLMVTPTHAAIVEPFAKDLADTVEQVRTADTGNRAGIAAVYGMAGAMTDRTPVRDLLIDLLGQVLPSRT